MTDLTPGSAEWARRVSPSKAAAMLGHSDWDTPFSMWHKMRGDVPWDEETPAMERGNLCEGAVLTWWQRHHDHADYREQVTIEHEDWCVATPDALATVEGEHVLIEAKTASASADDYWGDQYTDAIPLHYLTQVFLSMEVCHRAGIPVARAYVPKLGGYRMEFGCWLVEYDAEIGADILARCRAFYDTLDGDTPPPLDNGEPTWDVVRKLHPEIDRDLAIELTREQADDLVTFQHLSKETAASLLGAKSEVCNAMGRARIATFNGRTIARRQPRGESVTFVVTGKPEHLIEEENIA